MRIEPQLASQKKEVKGPISRTIYTINHRLRRPILVYGDQELGAVIELLTKDDPSKYRSIHEVTDRYSIEERVVGSSRSMSEADFKDHAYFAAIHRPPLLDKNLLTSENHTQKEEKLSGKPILML